MLRVYQLMLGWSVGEVVSIDTLTSVHRLAFSPPLCCRLPSASRASITNVASCRTMAVNMPSPEMTHLRETAGRTESCDILPPNATAPGGGADGTPREGESRSGMRATRKKFFWQWGPTQHTALRFVVTCDASRALNLVCRPVYVQYTCTSTTDLVPKYRRKAAPHS